MSIDTRLQIDVDMDQKSSSTRCAVQSSGGLVSFHDEATGTVSIIGSNLSDIHATVCRPPLPSARPPCALHPGHTRI
jgi:hypothetical protein